MLWQQKGLFSLTICCKFLRNLISYTFLHCNYFIHIYSPKARADKPLGSKFWCQQKAFTTSTICCNKSLWIPILCTSFHAFSTCIHSPGAGADNPLWTKFWCEQKGLVTLPICCKCQKNVFEVLFYTYFCLFLYMYIALGQMRSEFWVLHKPFVTLVICCKFRPSNDFLTVFPPHTSIRDQIWPCWKIGQGQPRVINWTNYNGPESPMLHTKPQGHWPFGYGEEDFWRVVIIYGRDGHLGHMTQTPWINFLSHIPLRLHMKFVLIGQAVLEKIFENGGRRAMAVL